GLRVPLVEAPVWAWRNAHVDRLVTSWTFQIVYWYVFKPAVLCAFLWVYQREVFSNWIGAALAFLAANFIVNSRPARAAWEAVTDALRSFGAMLRSGLIPAFVRFLVEWFKHLLHLAEAMLFAVDEWLRFRGGDRQAAMIVRAVLRAIWFPIGYFIRFNL